MTRLWRTSVATRVVLAFALILAAACLAACGSSDSSGSTEATGDGGGSDGGGETVTIGAVLAQTGLFSQYDVSNTIGAEIAAEDINAEGGVLDGELDLKVGDFKSEPPLGGSVARKLIGEGAKYIITSADFDFGSPAALAAQSAGVPAMSAGAEVPEFGIAGIGPNAFSMGTPVNTTAAAWAEFMHDEKGLDSPFLLEDPTLAYDTALCSNFKKAWGDISGASPIVGEDQFKNPDASIDAQISNIKNLNPQPGFIVLCSYPPGGATAIRQLRAAGVDLPIVAGDAFSGSAWLDAVGKLSDFYYTDYASVYGDDPDQKINDLIAEAKKRAKDPNSVVGVIVPAYSAVQAFKVAAEAAGSTDAEALVSALQEFNGEELLVGPTTFTPDLHITADRRLTVLEINNGEGKYVQQLTPKNVPPINE